MDHAEIESFAQEHLEHEKKFANALKSTINVVKKLTLQRDRAVAALAEMDGKRHALEEQLRRSATVCPQDGCMLWSGHERPHANAHEVRDALEVHDSWSTTAREIALLLGAEVEAADGNAESLQDAARRVVRERNYALDQRDQFLWRERDIANALFGPPPVDSIHFCGNLPEAVAKMVRERDEARTNHTHASDELGRWKRDYARLSELNAATIKERDELRQERDDDYRTFDRMTDLLTQVASALKGEPPELTLHGWHDLPELATKAVRERHDLRVLLDGILVRGRRYLTKEWPALAPIIEKYVKTWGDPSKEKTDRDEEQQRQQEAPAPEADGGAVRRDGAVRSSVDGQRPDMHARQGAQGQPPDDARGPLERAEAAVRALDPVQKQYLLGQLEGCRRSQFTAGPQAWVVWDAILRVARALAR